jgi:hypothetical protein
MQYDTVLTKVQVIRSSIPRFESHRGQAYFSSLPGDRCGYTLRVISHKQVIRSYNPTVKNENTLIKTKIYNSWSFYA